MPPAGVPGLGALAAAAGSLKEVRRKGWVDRGVSDAESVADHSYRVALLAWALARARGLDAERAMLIGLVHDLAEAEVGDETPYDPLLSGGQPAELAAELAAAWRDYDAQASPEARLVKQLDRVETLLQARAYAARQPDLPIGSFRRQVAAMSLPDDLAALVRRRRRPAEG